jgi:CBS-domain-containing membrane protein
MTSARCSDLESVMQTARRAAVRRMLQDTTCATIMTRRVLTVAPGTTQRDAARLLERRGLRVLPVVSPDGRLEGIVTRADLGLACEHARRPALAAVHGVCVSAARQQCATVRESMTASVIAIDSAASLEQLLHLYTATGHHHIPVLDARRRVVGIVTTTDIAGRLGWMPPGPSRRAG